MLSQTFPKFEKGSLEKDMTKMGDVFFRRKHAVNGSEQVFGQEGVTFPTSFGCMAMKPPSLQRNVDVNLSQISIHSSKLTWPWKKPPFLYIFVVFIRGKNNFYGYVCLPEGKSHQKNGQNQQA